MKKRIMNLGNILGAVYFIFVLAVMSVPCNISGKTALKITGIAAAVIVIISLNKAAASDKLHLMHRRLTASRVYIFCAVVMLAVDVIIALCIKYVPVTDASYMDIICRNFVEGRELYAGLDEYHTHYLERYSNQWGLFLIQSFIYKTAYAFFGRIPHLILPLVNAVTLQITYFFLFRLTGKLFKENMQRNLCMILMFVNPVLYGYSVIFYTDTLSMPFILCSLYLGISAFDGRSRKRFVILSGAAALCVGIGYCIKGSIAVIAVALVIYSFFALGLKRSLLFTSAMIIGFAVVKLGVTQIMYSTGTVSEQGIETYGFPKSHWIMMGLQGKGGYNEKSFMMTYDQPDMKTRCEHSIQMINKTLKDYGVSGLISHMKSKISYTWSDASYQLVWQMHETLDSNTQGFITGSAIYLSVCYIFQCLLLICMTASFISGAMLQRIDRMFLIRLAVLGLGVFLMLWETRSRYMLGMMPLFFIVSADGLEQIRNTSGSIKKRFRSKRNRFCVYVYDYFPKYLLTTFSAGFPKIS